MKCFVTTLLYNILFYKSLFHCVSFFTYFSYVLQHMFGGFCGPLHLLRYFSWDYSKYDWKLIWFCNLVGESSDLVASCSQARGVASSQHAFHQLLLPSSPLLEIYTYLCTFQCRSPINFIIIVWISKVLLVLIVLFTHLQTKNWCFRLKTLLACPFTWWRNLKRLQRLREFPFWWR